MEKWVGCLSTDLQYDRTRERTEEGRSKIRRIPGKIESTELGWETVNRNLVMLIKLKPEELKLQYKDVRHGKRKISFHSLYVSLMKTT